MKRTNLLGLLAAALLLSFGFYSINAGTPPAATEATSREDSVPGPGHNLRGSCIWQEVKYPTTGGEQQGVGPATILASITFDGSGGMTLDYDANINGIYSSTAGVPGTYSVDSTGHGTFAFTSPASNYLRTYDFRLSPNGRTIYTIAQADGTGVVAQRVSFGTCSF